MVRYSDDAIDFAVTRYLSHERHNQEADLKGTAGLGIYLRKDPCHKGTPWLSVVFGVAFVLPDTNPRRGV